jgi:hypothetical protein
MLKLVVALSVALAGSAQAAGWRSLRLDGSSEQAFAQSLEAFRMKLSPARRLVFGEALKDIWLEGVEAADAGRRDYTAPDYYRQVDGLSYERVVTFTDPTGATAEQRYRVASLSTRMQRTQIRPMRSALPRTWTNAAPYPSTGVRGTPNTQIIRN